jgi:hypothetical protein
MRIRINKCTNPRAWYADRIGHVMEVEWAEKSNRPDQGIPEDVYWCREGGEYNCINYVRKSDAEEIPMNDLSTYMAGELAKQMALEKDKILTACIRNVVGPGVRIKDVLTTGRVRADVNDDNKSEFWKLDGKPLVEIWPPETKIEDGRMTVSISYKVAGVDHAAEQKEKEGL